MRKKGSASELEACRLLAGRLLQSGRTIREVAEIVDASESAVKRWRQALRKGGLEALKSKAHPGRPSRLNPDQKRQLIEILQEGPRKAGYRTDLWTCARVAEVVLKTFGVGYHPSHIWKLLRGLGWTCQKPERRARERDEAAIEHWREHEWPRIKRGRNGIAVR